MGARFKSCLHARWQRTDCDLSLRVTEIDGTPWFLATDVCAALDIQDVTKVVALLADDDKQTLNVGLRGRAPWFVTEGGLYDILLNSRKAEAKSFRKWVTNTVLPAIRKDGAYVMGEEKVATGEMSGDELILKAMELLQAKVGA